MWVRENFEKKSLYVDSDGEIRFYDNGVATYAKLIYVNGHYYYINSSLKAVRDTTYWVSYPKGMMAEGNYTFDAQGRMTNPPEDALTEPVSTFALNGDTMTREYEYIYASGKLLRQNLTVAIDNGVANYTLDFFYDASGIPFALKYNGELFYYITNLQGDVMSIVDAQGAVVASYEYDPYGAVISATGSLAEINPLRYRGYVYDTESTLYYLQSRYYDPELGRFINADAFASTGQGILGNNMFAYCLNNPVVLVDTSGTAAHIGFSADGQIHDAPWRIGSPGGGGWPQDIHYSQQDYGAVADKFLTVIALKFVYSDVITPLIDSATNQIIIQAEMQQRKVAAAVEMANYLGDNPLVAIDLGTATVGIGSTVVGIGATVGVFSVPVAGQVALGVVGCVCGMWGLGRVVQVILEGLS